MTAKSYSREDLQTILANLRATACDYLVLTYFRIHKIYSGPLYNKNKRRFNNIIIPDFPEIARGLTTSVFLPKCFEVLWRELAPRRYISAIHSKTRMGCTPIVIQFFDKSVGVQYRQLECQCAPWQLATALLENGAIEKIVGYCGDYRFKDPGNVNDTSDYIVNLRILSGNDVLNLPTSDGFVEMLFRVLLDYLPDDVIQPLVMLGEVSLNSGNTSVVINQLSATYAEWRAGQKNILLSSYVDYVTGNYTAINNYLKPLLCLPHSLTSLFSNVEYRFLLVFVKELYRKLAEYQLRDNNAVAYFFHLRELRDTFQKLHEGDLPLSEPWCYLNTEIEYLREHNQLTSEDDQRIQDLDNTVLDIIHMTYIRAVTYLDYLLRQFGNFDTHGWVLLTDLPIKFDQVHGSYHQIKEAACDKCRDLEREVQAVNCKIARVPLMEVRGVASKWVMILNDSCFPLILELVEFLLALPASYDMAQTQDHEDCVESTIRVNLEGVKDVEVVERVEEFFEGYLGEARDIISKNQTPFLVE